MLYCFREAQAAELDLGTRADRRPKMVSACKSLRECERSKVPKIQDGSLTDYEVRDTLGEPYHCTGNANYRRNVVILDDDGKEVPGTMGHKYTKFMNQGPACFSDLDEADGKLLEHARQEEEKEWRDEYSNMPSPHGGADSMRAYANTPAAYLGFWSPEDLMLLTLPTGEEMEDVLLALVEEYLGE
ncbi:Isy1-like splicing factor [Suillus fuscotomentosus]|uniref:Isy1-like splicing factor n=1 Tax=Suillus fuscotomentosus TaxID=1912939 RepID=A0AAD4EQ20_9AGAM|nr:Isy1-like splicing factor [Suillus fuscotomentosus]KAG1908598.1 Isy1-like splicing factor [Suillus fuscotomentosus]